MNTTENIIKKTEAIQSIYKVYTSIPNLFDVVRLNENAHTRVIYMILNYRRKKIPIFLKSFLVRFSDAFESLSNDDLSKSKIYQQLDYIDCLIQVGKYFIVIENKIHGAKDQHQQLDSYIAKAGEDKTWVYAVYLTLTGGEPSESSLSEETKKIIGERLVKINYLTHILDWLQNDVLPECTVRESLLENSLRIYIDHLNGMLGQKHHEKKLLEELAKIVQLEITSEFYLLLQKSLIDIKINLNSETDEKIIEQNECFSTAIQALLREIEKRIPYVNEDNVAYVLKYMFRNCPPWKERSFWVDNCSNVDPFVSGFFLHVGCRYLRLTGLNIEIHLRCSVVGIKDGPYILLEPDKAEERFGKENLESLGLLRGRVYTYPFPSFDEKETSLVDVALHIKRLVDGLKTLQALSGV